MPTRMTHRSLSWLATPLGALALADAAAANTFTQISDPNAGSQGGPAVTWAYGLNNAGTIVGFYEPNGAGGGLILGDYEDANGDFYGFITSVPEPATWTVMLLGVGAIGVSLRRRRSAASLKPA